MALHIRCSPVKTVMSNGLLAEFVSRMFYGSSLLVFRDIRGIQIDYVLLFFGCTLTCVSLPIAIWTRADFRRNSRKDLGWIFLRWITGIFSAGGSVSAVQFMPVSDVAALQKCTPVLMTVLGCIFYRQRPLPITYLLLLLSVGGIFLISRPSFLFSESDNVPSNYRLFGSLLALASCLGTSLAYVVQRQIRHTSLPVVGVFMGIFPLPVFLTSTLIRGSWTSQKCASSYLLPLGSLVMYTGFMLRLVSGSLEKVGSLALMTIVDLPVIFLVETIFMGLRPPWTSYVGSVMVAVCAVSAVVLKYRSEKKNIRIAEQQDIELEEKE